MARHTSVLRVKEWSWLCLGFEKKHGTEADHACHVRVLWKLDQNVAK